MNSHTLSQAQKLAAYAQRNGVTAGVGDYRRSFGRFGVTVQTPWHDRPVFLADREDVDWVALELRRRVEERA